MATHLEFLLFLWVTSNTCHFQTLEFKSLGNRGECQLSQTSLLGTCSYSPLASLPLPLPHIAAELIDSLCLDSQEKLGIQDFLCFYIPLLEIWSFNFSPITPLLALRLCARSTDSIQVLDTFSQIPSKALSQTEKVF